MKTYPIIDAHVHISLYNDHATDLASSLQQLVESMKKLGISHAIVIPDNVEGLSTIAGLEDARKLLAGKTNFFLLGSPNILKNGTTELSHFRDYIEQKIICGLKFFPGHEAFYPTDERLSPYYELCEQTNTPIIFHTGENSGDSECAQYNDPKYIVEIAKRYPRLKLIITHYFWPQLDYCYEITREIPNIYFELAGTADAEVLEKSGGWEKMQGILTKTVLDRPDKVIFGTDWPMCDVGKHIEMVHSLDISEDMKKWIFWDNAVAVYTL